MTNDTALSLKRRRLLMALGSSAVASGLAGCSGDGGGGSTDSGDGTDTRSDGTEDGTDQQSTDSGDQESADGGDGSTDSGDGTDTLGDATDTPGDATDTPGDGIEDGTDQPTPESTSKPPGEETSTADVEVVEIPRYEFSEGESYTYDALFESEDGARESVETWEVTSVDGDDLTVEVRSEVDGETETTTFSGTHSNIYDRAAEELVLNFFAPLRAPLSIAEMGELSAGNSFTIQSGATVEVDGETNVNGVTCTEFTVVSDGESPPQNYCVAEGYPFAVSANFEDSETVIDLTLTDATRP
jgi:hypothetical protein